MQRRLQRRAGVSDGSGRTRRERSSYDQHPAHPELPRLVTFVPVIPWLVSSIMEAPSVYLHKQATDRRVVAVLFAQIKSCEHLCMSTIPK